ncbi:MAG TPA: hypothetical protein VL171_00805 [Verrucomicrobiae bacterium]|nr:hypothetical protein [Verrucomicrobiae bacterium]
MSEITLKEHLSRIASIRTPARAAASRKNLERARDAAAKSPKAKAARRRNAAKATAARWKNHVAKRRKL